MRRVLGSAFVSLDGVMQAPGGPTEDPTGGFPFGGWLPPLADAEMGEAIDRLFDRDFDLLLGRRTYDIFAAHWPYIEGGEDESIARPFNACTKYVLTRGSQPLEWEPCVRVETLDQLAAIREEDGPDLVIQGSSTLYPQLIERGLLDRLTLMIFPVLLGSGKRLFGDGTPPRTMELVEHRISSRGSAILTYEPRGKVETGTFATPGPSAREKKRQERMKEGSW